MSDKPIEEKNDISPAPEDAANGNGDAGLEGGAYEIIQKRLFKLGDTLLEKIDTLNGTRKQVFGSLEAKVLRQDRIATRNNCVARDMISIGSKLIFGYNVFIGLKKQVKISDVFSVYQMKENSFEEVEPGFLADKSFLKDFQDLYTYYKETRFATFLRKDSIFLMIFQTGKKVTDIKVFKWEISGDDELTYINNRSEAEYTLPEQHDFEWKRATRDDFITGDHPHVSIEDRVFVETIGGDLTIKVENNTSTGKGIYSEDVEKKDQTLNDAEIFYSILGPIILLKILPYQEKDYRYIIYDDKKKMAVRVDDIGQCGIRLPEDEGLIFPGGYYSITEGYKAFKIDTSGMIFLRVIASPNGEDYFYVFYNLDSGEYILLQYNLISKKVESPIRCNGYALYDSGIMVFFKADDEAKKSHSIQVWQTPFVADVSFTKIDETNSLSRIGNKELVKGIADLRSIYTLVRTEQIYLGLYHDIVKKTTETMDLYYWLDNAESGKPKEELLEIKKSANSAISEYEKVLNIRKNTGEAITSASEEVHALTEEIITLTFDNISIYVDTISTLSALRGKIISLKDLRYADVAVIEELEKTIAGEYDTLTEKCVNFLLGENALAPFGVQIDGFEKEIPDAKKVTAMNEIGEKIEKCNSDLDLLSNLVSTLKIEDATQTARIIDDISAVYARLNQIKTKHSKKRKELLSQEVGLEFNAQYKLLNQTITNYMDQATTVDKCEEGLTKLMISIEELQGKFSDFDELVEKLTAKQEEVYSSFNSKKVQLEEKLQKKTSSLAGSADRILKGISGRLETLKTIEEINGYFASDRMVLKIRDIVEQLFELKDSVKAEDIAGRIKSLQQEGVRQLKDKLDLYTDGEGIITLGDFKFTVNKQAFGLTTVFRDNFIFYHLTGTDFFEKIDNEDFLATREFWNQDLPSETKEVYRAEYLAYKIFSSILTENSPVSPAALSELIEKKADDKILELIKERITGFIDEGYEKGVHDNDCLVILKALHTIYSDAGTLGYHTRTRAYALLYWYFTPDSPEKSNLAARIESLGVIESLAGQNIYHELYIKEADAMIRDFYRELGYQIDEKYLVRSAAYLVDELKLFNPDKGHAISGTAFGFFESFNKYLSTAKKTDTFTQLLAKAEDDLKSSVHIAEDWLKHFLESTRNSDGNAEFDRDYLEETLVLVLLSQAADTKKYVSKSQTREIETRSTLTGLYGEHPVIDGNTMQFSLGDFLIDMADYHENKVPRYREYTRLKHRLAEEKSESLGLTTFKPRILTSFVRNKLIDQVYLHLIGTNLSKQMGAYGEKKRTDLMGLLLLISPPGYGKTTLMEYIANRLGLIFMKINGPAIGHRVTSLDPAECPNATAREEVEKLNLSLEMGNNVMLYLDDIQHLNPEFLQKFISLCDAQRKIEGVYKGKTRTYDLRGKKFCVIMAGNPYTESGEKFRIPDMLSNRADTYNLGDIIGGSEDVFNLSYLENCLTSNPVLGSLVTKSQHDVYQMIKAARTGSTEGLDFEAKYSVEEMTEYIDVFKKLLTVQEIVLEVNKLYIYSASQDDDYRTEPKFLLQGSYRNMNKLAEKILPILNESELRQILLDHYNDESQLLTTGAEFNLLRFKELSGWINEEEQERIKTIRSTFARNKKLGGAGGKDAMANIMGQFTLFNDEFTSLATAVKENMQEKKAKRVNKTGKEKTAE